MNELRPTTAVGGLERPRRGRLVAGVCAGLARRFGLPRFLIRALFVASMLLPGPQILVYLALWAITPNEAAAGAR